jgi:hypothetical protein
MALATVVLPKHALVCNIEHTEGVELRRRVGTRTSLSPVFPQRD